MLGHFPVALFQWNGSKDFSQKKIFLCPNLFYRIAVIGSAGSRATTSISIALWSLWFTSTQNCNGRSCDETCGRGNCCCQRGLRIFVVQREEMESKNFAASEATMILWDKVKILEHPFWKLQQYNRSGCKTSAYLIMCDCLVGGTVKTTDRNLLL